MASLNQPLDVVPLAFVDVETTGLDPAWGDRVCEIAILRCQGGEVVDALQRLVNPQRRMGLGALRVHGITDEMLRGAPPFAQVARDVLELLEGAVVVGHNTPFDLGFLAKELGRLGAALPNPIALDTLRLARRCYRLPSYSLGRVAEALQVQVNAQEHRAMSDVLTTRGVFLRLMERLSAGGARSLGDYVEAQGGPIVVERAPRYDLPAEIQEALCDNRLLHLHYRAEDGTETERIVRPMDVSEQGGHLLLVAHCHLRDATRYFRLDRILSMDVIVEFE